MYDYNITLKRIDDIVKKGQNVILFKKLLKLVPINILNFFFKKNLGGAIVPQSIYRSVPKPIYERYHYPKSPNLL